MKNASLFACLLVLTLGASAQSSRSVSPIAIPPNARGGVSANPIGITRIHRTAEAQSADSAASSVSSDAKQVPPTAKAPPIAVKVPPTAKK